MTPDQVQHHFTRADGGYLFARWGRPIVPVVFGTDDATLAAVKGAVEAVVALAGHRMAETDPELGANLWFFFFREWDELLAVPDLGRLLDEGGGGLGALVGRLTAGQAHQYRLFRFDADGAIRACFTFLRIGGDLAGMPAEVLALNEAVQTILLWSDRAFAERGPLAQAKGVTVLRPDVAAVIRAGYDPVMPSVARDASHALRLAARAGLAP